ncbi:MAG: hypothetical protein KF836_08300 [Fimbriimonadaceae bacterium]|nr:hypothetical protein [Fimbriimonadaceae bacterium]
MITELVGLTQAAHESFLHALAFQMYKWSGTRETISQAMIAKVFADVKSQFEAGLTNPAVAQGYVIPVSFNVDDPDADDFYKGRASRAGHIAAQKDVRRAKAHQDLEHSLKDSNVTAIISSSGQGKSALALRHLSDYTTENFVYEVKVCRTAEDAAAIALFVRFRLQLGLGVSLFIDNLSRAQGAWNELATALASEPVEIIVTSREEDWKLFAGDLSRVNWKRVTPTLELEEAREIFVNLQRSNALHHSVQTADEAYARVSEAKLLIEYVYLLTQGELLEERLSRQIENLNSRDPGAVECVRLVSLADQMNLRVEATGLLKIIEFQGDAQLALKGIEDEYLVVHDGLCSGLHPVRSQHLVKLLHPYGVDSSVAKLLQLIEDGDLPEFTYSLLARTNAKSDQVVSTLVKRINYTGFNPIWEAAYSGSEVRQAQTCLPLLKTLEERVGQAAVNLFPFFTPPFQGQGGILELMRDNMDGERFEILRKTVESVPGRDYASRFEAVLAMEYARVSDMNRSVGDTLGLAKALWLSGQNDKVKALLDALNWREILSTLPLPLALRLSFLVQETQGGLYEAFVLERRDEVVTYLVQETRSLSIEEDDDKLVLSFIVDPYNEVRDNEQAVSRLQAAKGLLPGYGSYATKPVRPLKLPIPLAFDDAHKDGPSENWYSEEISTLNKPWTAAIEVVTATDGIVGWELTQRSAIESAAEILDYFTRFLKLQDEGRNIVRIEKDACANLIDEFELRKEARLQLPSTLSDEQRTDLRIVDDLFDAVYHVVRNLLDELLSKDEGQVNRKQVILFGLRDVHNLSQSAQESLDTVRQKAGLDNGKAFATWLQTATERLYGSVERREQVKQSQMPLNSLSSNTAQFLHRKLEEANSELARRVTLAKKALLFTPGGTAKRFDTPSWLFTLEVEEIENLVTEALRVCMVLAEAFDSFQGNFITIPVRNGRRVSPQVYRALAPVIRDFIAGKEPESLIIWPMDDPGELPNALFNLQSYPSRPELDLVQPFLEAGEKLAYAKAASLVEARTPGASTFFTEWSSSELLAESFYEALSALKEFVPTQRLETPWNDVLVAVKENVAVLENYPDQFLMKNNLLVKPLDRYLAAKLAEEM